MSISPDQEVIQCPSSPTSTSITVGEATQASRTSLLPSRVRVLGGGGGEEEEGESERGAGRRELGGGGEEWLRIQDGNG